MTKGKKTVSMNIVFYYEYSLTACGPLNAKTAELCRTGALIRTDEGGYGCIHPWTELGDASLQEELEALRRGAPLPLGLRALDCAAADGAARKQGINLFTGLHIPDSHATLPSCVSPATVRLMDMKGFKAGKIKAGANLSAVKERLTILASMAPSWRWRLDFNGSLNETEALKFWKSLSHDLRCQIEFIEDPCPFSLSSWERLVDAGMSLALDLGSDQVHQPPMYKDLPVTRIVKPAREATPDDLYDPPVFTTVMDHPLGQLWAVYEAAYYYRNALPTEIPLCGLSTHLLFQPDPFIDQMGGLNPKVSIPEGTGLGFDQMLEELPWKAL